MHPKGIIFAVLGGLTGTLGVLFFIIALGKGKVSVIVPLTALYPIITITLGFLILKESITLTQGVGVIFALIAVLLLAI
jgi:transporter family protein